MYHINTQINNQFCDKLQVQQLVRTKAYEVLSISMEKGITFPEHISPTDAQLIVLEGDIVFYIGGESLNLIKHEHFSFSKDVKHWVVANENSKFLIIR